MDNPLNSEVFSHTLTLWGFKNSNPMDFSYHQVNLFIAETYREAEEG